MGRNARSVLESRAQSADSRIALDERENGPQSRHRFSVCIVRIVLGSACRAREELVDADLLELDAEVSPVAVVVERVDELFLLVYRRFLA